LFAFLPLSLPSSFQFTTHVPLCSRRCCNRHGRSALRQGRSKIGHGRQDEKKRTDEAVALESVKELQAQAGLLKQRLATIRKIYRSDRQALAVLDGKSARPSSATADASRADDVLRAEMACPGSPHQGGTGAFRISVRRSPSRAWRCTGKTQTTRVVRCGDRRVD
jgi:hypothetical protein